MSLSLNHNILISSDSDSDSDSDSELVASLFDNASRLVVTVYDAIHDDRRRK